MFRQRLLPSCALALCASLNVGVAEAQVTCTGSPCFTAVQDNGSDCVPDERTPNDSYSRNALGITHTDPSVWLGTFCPLTPPSDDTWGINGSLYALEVHYSSSGELPVCSVVARDNVGSRYYGPDLIPGTSATAGTTVLRLPAPYLLGNFIVSEGVRCSIPPGVRILGVTARRNHGRVTGGI
jgi:hypothetical protein